MATNVTPAVRIEVTPASRVSPITWVTPTRATAPGTSSQKAGRKVTIVGGPVR